MQASYISYFGGSHGLDNSESPCQVDVEAGASDTVINVKKAAHPKIRREKSKVLVAERSELISQYRLDL
jgi:hypothetical protein